MLIIKELDTDLTITVSSELSNDSSVQKYLF